MYEKSINKQLEQIKNEWIKNEKLNELNEKG